MKRIGIGIVGVAIFPLVALAIVGGLSLYSTWAIPDPNFNFGWEVDPGAEREDIRRVQIPLPPMWTPNSQYIVFNANDQMHAVDLSVMSLYSFRLVQELSFEHAGSISNSGSIALTQRGYTHDEFGKDKQEIETVEIDGANRRLVIAGDPHYYPYHPVWSPNGDFIAFLTTWNPYGMRLHIMDIVDGDASNVSVRALDITAHLTPPVWSNSGSLIAFVSKESSDKVGDYRYAIHVVNRASTGYARLRRPRRIRGVKSFPRQWLGFRAVRAHYAGRPVVRRVRAFGIEQHTLSVRRPYRNGAVRQPSFTGAVYVADVR